MRKLILIFLLATPVYGQVSSQVKIALGSTYANGNATAVMIVPVEQSHGLQTLFLDPNGQTIFSTLLQGNVYLIKVCNSVGGSCLATTIIPNGNTQDISSALLANPYSGGGMVYPGAGVANSTGSAWGTSYAVGTASNDLVQLDGSARLPAVDGSQLTGLPSAPVSSVFGRTGAVVAVLNDYNFNQLAGLASCPQLPALTGDTVSISGSCNTTTSKLNGNTPGGTCTNQFTRSIDSSGRPLCFTVTGSDMASSTVTATQLAAQYSQLGCEPGLGDGLNAIAAGTYLQYTCYNYSGVTWTITGIKCNTDNSGSSTLNVTNGAGTALLTGAITCTSSFAAGTQSGTTTIASGDYVKFTFVADGTSKQATWVVSFSQ